MLTEDWMMRQVDALARSIAYLVFQKDSTDYVPGGTAEDAALDELHRRLLEKVNAGDIGGAEDLLFAESDPDEHMPDYDAKSEALLPLLERDVKAHFHCHRADDICTAIRIAKEFNLDYVIIHGTEGHLIADILAEENAPVIAGPILCDRCKPEMQHLTISGPSIMQKAGVKLALCTDHPVIPIQYLPTTAALAVKGGMQREDALYAITAGAAEILGVENRIGSIAAGMDADLQLYRGDPLDLLCDPWLVMINGRRVAADLTPQFQV